MDRDAQALVDERLADLRKANDALLVMSFDRSSDIQRNNREISWLRDLRSLLLRHAQHKLDPATIKTCANVALEQRCERGTPWDRACVTIAEQIRSLSVTSTKLSPPASESSHGG